MSDSTQSRQLDATLALQVMEAARAFFDFSGDSVPLAVAAKRMGVGVDWVRSHLGEFPNAWRLPAGERVVNGEGRNVGELRIPLADIAAFQQRQRIRRNQ